VTLGHQLGNRSIVKCPGQQQDNIVNHVTVTAATSQAPSQPDFVSSHSTDYRQITVAQNYYVTLPIGGRVEYCTPSVSLSVRPSCVFDLLEIEQP